MNIFNTSSENPPIPLFLRLVTAVESVVVFAGGLLLFFTPDIAQSLWAWPIPPFNSRFVGALYFAAFFPLIILVFNPRWIPGRFVLWLIFVFTTLIMVVMIVHWNSFAWDRPSTYLVFWPLYFFLPINSAIFLFRSRGMEIQTASNLPSAWRGFLFAVTFFSGLYGLGLLFAPEPLTSFWPWHVDAFHARIYASAFVTPAVGAWILNNRRSSASEYLIFGLNLTMGGFLPVLGTLWTNASVPIERQIQFNLGTYTFFAIFLLTGILGIWQIIMIFNKRAE